MKKAPQLKAAFTLVEVVLSLLVFAIGVLAVLGLFPGGLLHSKRSHSDTYISQFAEMALNAVGTELEINQDFWRTNNFAAISSNYYLTSTTPDGIDPPPWKSPPGVRIRPAIQTLEYQLFGDTNIVDRALRYKLTLERSPYMMAESGDPMKETKMLLEVITNDFGEVFTVSNMYYQFRTNYFIPMDEHIIKAKLKVYPGLYGDDGYRYFFRYYFNYKNK